MAEAQPRPGPPGILILPFSRAASRHLGPLAWLVLEEFALEAEAGTLAVETSVRRLAAEFGVGKEAAATALSRLIDFGLIRCQTRRRGGRYAGSSYILDADACRRAGVIITTDAAEDRRYPDTPCPARRDTAEPHTAQRDTTQRDAANWAGAAVEATGTALTSRPTPDGPQRTRVERSATGPGHTTEQSLLDFSDQPSPSPPPEPLTSTTPLSSTTPDPVTTPDPATTEPDNPSYPLLPLTPSNQPDALAPGVRRGPVNVAGNGASDRSALNENLNGEAGSPC